MDGRYCGRGWGSSVVAVSCLDSFPVAGLLATAAEHALIHSFTRFVLLLAGQVFHVVCVIRE